MLKVVNADLAMTDLPPYELRKRAATNSVYRHGHNLPARPNVLHPPFGDMFAFITPMLSGVNHSSLNGCWAPDYSLIAGKVRCSNVRSGDWEIIFRGQGGRREADL
jgi:hypothetical protein